MQSGEAIAIGESRISFFAGERVRASVSGLRCFATRKDGSCSVDWRDSDACELVIPSFNRGLHSECAQYTYSIVSGTCGHISVSYSITESSEIKKYHLSLFPILHACRKEDLKCGSTKTVDWERFVQVVSTAIKDPCIRLLSTSSSHCNNHNG